MGVGGKESIFSEKNFYKKITGRLGMDSNILSGKTGSFQKTVLDIVFEYLRGGGEMAK